MPFTQYTSVNNINFDEEYNCGGFDCPSISVSFVLSFLSLLQYRVLSILQEIEVGSRFLDQKITHIYSQDYDLTQLINEISFNAQLLLNTWTFFVGLYDDKTRSSSKLHLQPLRS
jgi:hypothetical protein